MYVLVVGKWPPHSESQGPLSCHLVALGPSCKAWEASQFRRGWAMGKRSLGCSPREGLWPFPLSLCPHFLPNPGYISIVLNCIAMVTSKTELFPNLSTNQNSSSLNPLSLWVFSQGAKLLRFFPLYIVRIVTFSYQTFSSSLWLIGRHYVWSFSSHKYFQLLRIFFFF